MSPAIADAINDFYENKREGGYVGKYPNREKAIPMGFFRSSIEGLYKKITKVIGVIC